MSKRIRVHDDIADELEAMATTYRELKKLDEPTRQRVWDYLWDRYVVHPAKAAP